MHPHAKILLLVISDDFGITGEGMEDIPPFLSTIGYKCLRVVADYKARGNS